jgi:hypothetical protein
MLASKPYRIHPEAWLEIEAADNWYVERSVDASANFIAAISEGFGEHLSSATALAQAFARDSAARSPALSIFNHLL